MTYGWSPTGLAVAIALLTGCVSPAEQAAMDRQRCAGFGFAPGSEAMANCTMNISQQRQAEQAAMQRQNARNDVIQQQMDRERRDVARAQDEAAMQRNRDQFMREFNSGGPNTGLGMHSMPSVSGMNCVGATAANAGSLTCR